jgi:ketosteroid isomerase-like protein
MTEDTTHTPTAAARAYYRALDTGDYDLLAGLLTPGFVHERPDMSLEGSDQFVQFMRDERPMTDTSHPIDSVYEQVDGDGVVVRGRLLSADRTTIARFADEFSFEGEKIARIRTFTQR